MSIFLFWFYAIQKRQLKLYTCLVDTWLIPNFSLWKSHFSLILSPGGLVVLTVLQTSDSGHKTRLEVYLGLLLELSGKRIIPFFRIGNCMCKTKAATRYFRVLGAYMRLRPSQRKLYLREGGKGDIFELGFQFLRPSSSLTPQSQKPTNSLSALKWFRLSVWHMEPKVLTKYTLAWRCHCSWVSVNCHRIL